MPSAIAKLLEMTGKEKQEKGLSSTPQEIEQQPRTWQSTFDRFARRKAALSEFLEASGFNHHDSAQPSFLLVGAGTSDYIGKAVAPVLRRNWNCGVTAVASTELLTNSDDHILPGKKYMAISFSRSGNSSEGVALLSQIQGSYPGRVGNLIVTCNEHGKMRQYPGVFPIVLDELVDDKGLAMTSSFTNMVVAGQCLANIDSLGAYEKYLHVLIEAGSRLMPVASDIAAELAGRGFRRICFLGSGALHAVAEESALKVLELNAGRIPTLAQSHLGLRHGPLSFVNHETLVVSYLSSAEPRRSYELDLIEEIRRKDLCGAMLVVAPSRDARLDRLSKYVLVLDTPKDLPDDYLSVLDVIPGQLLGLFNSIGNQITPDTPSTGAIARVVSHVRIYPAAGAAAPAAVQAS